VKIAIIQNYIRPYSVGGAEINVEYFARHLAEKGIPTVLITSGKNLKMEVLSPHRHLKLYRFYPLNLYFNYPPNVRRNKIIKVLWWVLNLWNPFVYLNVRAILKREKPNLVNIRNFYGFSPSVFTAAKSLKLPVIFTAHDFFALCKNSSFLKNETVCQEKCLVCSLWGSWNRIFMKEIKFHFLSEFSAGLYHQYLSPKGLFIAPNPVYLNEEEIKKNISLRTKMLSERQSIRFIFLGRLSRHKGLMTLLNAFSKVRCKNAELLIGGEGEIKKDVEDYVKIDPRIKYLGFVKGERKNEALLSADVLVLPSEWYEVSPLTIQEAYGFGLPVIGTDLGSIPEHIDTRETGWLFPYRDLASLARIMDDLCQSKQEIIRRSKACFSRALQNTSLLYIEKVIENYRALIL